MYSSRFFSFSFFVFAANMSMLLLTRSAEASCGLHICPIPASSKSDMGASQLMADTRFVSFDIGGKGSYTQTTLMGFYDHKYFRAGGVLPVIYLDAPGVNRAGLGNAMGYGEFYLINDATTRLSLGSQLELPTASDSGMGSNHFMAVPYVNYWQALAAWRIGGQLGMMQTLSSHDHGSPSPTSLSGGAQTVLYVNPHANTELMARAFALYAFTGVFSAELGSSVRQVASHDATGDKTFVDVGGAIRAAIGSGLGLRAGIDVPVTSQARYFYQVSFGLMYFFDR